MCSTRSSLTLRRRLQHLPNETVIDGELVALGPDGRPDFNLLQNFRSAESRIVYFAFDILISEGRRLTKLPLSERRAILASVVEPGEHVALSQVSDRSAAQMLQFVKSHGLEGAVAKRSDSVYQPGQRTGLWSKYRVDLRQEFVVGGYVPAIWESIRWSWASTATTDLIYAARVSAGLVPATRREVFERLKHLRTPKCPFVNLPEPAAGRWGQGLTAEKMKELCLGATRGGRRDSVSGMDGSRPSKAHQICRAQRRQGSG